MPIYEYSCDTCGEKFEKLLRPSQINEYSPDCPKCNSKEVKKLISKSSFTLKGGGWASEGYGS